MEFLAGKVYAQWSLRKELDDAEMKAVSSLVNKLGLKMRHVSQQQEVMAFTVEWIAEKAKDRRYSTKLLFDILFGVDSFLAKSWSFLLRFCLLFMVYAK